MDTTPPPTDPPLPTDTPELTPTLELTPEPTAELTADVIQPAEPVPTVELTLEATAAPTEITPTAEVTDLPTLPTATPTPFPTEPPLTLLFSDTFDSGALYLWTLGAGWSLTPSEGGSALTVSGSDAPLTFVHNTLSDAAAEARVQFEAGAVRLSLQVSEVARYSVVLAADGTLTLYRGETALASGAVSATPPGGWRTLRLSVIAGVLRVSVDGIDVLTAFDDAPLPPGTLTLESVGGNALTVDDVSVWLAGDGATAPLETPTPESIPFPSTGFGVTSAPSARSAEMQTAGSFVFRQNFDTSSQLRTRVTGQPAAAIGSAVGLAAGSGLSAFAQKSATTSQPVSLQLDFQIGRDPLTVYRVTGYTWVGATQFIGAQHTFTVQLKDRDDVVLFERSCVWTASAATPNPCDLQPPAGIDQVRTMTLLISLPATTATGKLNVDDFELYADLETTIQPAAILTSDILYARSAAVNNDAFLEYADASGYPPETLFGSFPVWSMDGSQLSYLDSALLTCIADASLSPINVQTCVDSPLLLPAIPDSQWSPVWSPDGTRVAYLQVTNNGSRLDLFVRNSDDLSGATTFNLTEYETTTLHLMPAWAPAAQGNKIAFAAGADRDNLSLYVIDLDNGNHITQITTGGNHILPLWSETGTALAFVNPGAGWTDPQFFDIPLNLSAPPVTQPAATFAPPATSRWGQVWTPTGSLFASLTRYDLGNFDIVDSGGALIDRGLMPMARQPQQLYKYQAIPSQPGTCTLPFGPCTGWTQFELNEIDIAVRQVGLSFHTLNALTPPSPAHAADTFNRVMVNGDLADEILFVRVDNPTGQGTFSYTSKADLTFNIPYNVAQGNCFAQDAQNQANPPIPAMIICNGLLRDRWRQTAQGYQFTGEATQHTFVHELGHLFDYRSAQSANQPANRSNGEGGMTYILGGYPGLSPLPISDCNTPRQVVMGFASGNWTRGERGWGSGPSRQANGNPFITDFQQNPANIHSEAAADMFLNWVYRSVVIGQQNPLTNPCTQSAAWTGPGFLNQDWRGMFGTVGSASPSGTPDNIALPGDNRYHIFHNQVILRLFQANSQW